MSPALLAATAALAISCASHVVELEPAPPMDARYGDEPGICLLGIPALVDEGGGARLAVSSNSDRLAVAVDGTQVILTPVSPAAPW